MLDEYFLGAMVDERVFRFRYGRDMLADVEMTNLRWLQTTYQRRLIVRLKGTLQWSIQAIVARNGLSPGCCLVPLASLYS